MLLRTLFAFKDILSVIYNVIDLKIYQRLHLPRGVDYSSVIVESSGIKGNVLFKEEGHESVITLYDLIIQ